MSVKTRLFLILFVAGMVGVLSFLLLDLEAIVALAPAWVTADAPVITPFIKILSLIQPAILLAGAVLIGVVLSPKVGLSAPVAEALATGGRWLRALRPQLVPGLLGALIGAAGVVATSAILKPFLMRETTERIHSFFQLVPIPTRLLYGGITEELLMRWGLMTLVTWIAWRVTGKGSIKPATTHYVVAILISSLLFALGHLPTAVIVLGEMSVALVLFVIVANSIFGVVAGYLYWKYGLEAAMVAHMTGHVFLASASYAGAYF